MLAETFLELWLKNRGNCCLISHWKLRQFLAGNQLKSTVGSNIACEIDEPDSSLRVAAYDGVYNIRSSESIPSKNLSPIREKQTKGFFADWVGVSSYDLT